MRWLLDYGERLNRSFAAVYVLLERPIIARRAIVILLIIHSGLLAYSAYVHSPTLNEPGHLVAGLSNWKFGRFDIYNVNPPLIRMVAALPVMAVGYEEDWSGFYTGPGARPEMAMGEDFVAANGERSYFLFMIARWVCIAFSWIGGTVCYLWARDLYGRPAGVIACSIWCFEPNNLAHASLITPDAHATALGLAACYTFWRWLKKPTWSQTAVTGVVLGLAELAKTTLILLYPLWPLMWLVYRWPDRAKMFARDWFREAGMLAVRMVIGLYILNLGYGFQGSLQLLDKYHFVSDLFTGGAAEGSGPNLPPSKRPVSGDTPLAIELPASGLQLPVTTTNRFAHTFLAAFPVPFPKNYLLGIDLQQKDFEDYGRPSYLRGEWHDRGWWYYYLYAVAIKVPLGLWLIGGLSLGLRLCKRLRAAGRGTTASFRDEFILLAPPLIVFTVVSSKTGFNEHMRYVLPCFPFAYIWVASFAQNYVVRDWRRPEACGRVVFRATVAITVCSGLMLWFATSSLFVYPHSLSYFNEAVGGPLNGAKHLVSSSIDWGQDLKYLQWQLSHRHLCGRRTPLVLAYFGCVNPRSVGFTGAISNSAQLALTAPQDPDHNSYAVSINFLQGMPGHAYGADGEVTIIKPGQFNFLQRTNPTFQAGYSMLFFQVPDASLRPNSSE